MTYLKHKANGNGATKKTQRETSEAPKERCRTGGPEDYGACYWCVKTEVSEDGEIYVFADEVRFTPCGGVLFLSRDGDTEQARLALAQGQWSAVYAASCWDGGAVAVDHWKGEVAR
jgi:hypothetical protein